MDNFSPSSDDKETLKAIAKQQITELTRRLHAASPLHMRDPRMKPSDGYANYVTIAERQIINLHTSDIQAQLNEWKKRLAMLESGESECQI